MARIAGVNIPTQKRVEISLTYIYGIGRTHAKAICKKTEIPSERRVHELTDDEVVKIRELIDSEYQVEGDLRSIPSLLCCIHCCKDSTFPAVILCLILWRRCIVLRTELY